MTLASSDDPFGELFSSLQDDETPDIKPHDAEYVCVRRYVKEGHLTTHEITENPKKINMFGVDCVKVIEEAKNNAANGMASDEYLKPEQKQCVVRRFKRGGYFDNMAIAVALRQSNLNANQMYEEKVKFIEKMKSMTADLNVCVMKKKKEKKEEEKEETS